MNDYVTNAPALQLYNYLCQNAVVYREISIWPYVTLILYQNKRMSFMWAPGEDIAMVTSKNYTHSVLSDYTNQRSLFWWIVQWIPKTVLGMDWLPCFLAGSLQLFWRNRSQKPAVVLTSKADCSSGGLHGLDLYQ